MSLKHGLLGLLNYGSMTGYELSKTFNDSLGFFWQGKTSQIYRELTDMEKLGWLKSERVVQHDKPNKKLYTITEDGRNELSNWLIDGNSSINDALYVRSSFLMRVFFAGEVSSSQATSLIREFQKQCKLALSAFDTTSSIIDEYSKIVADKNKSKYWRIVAMFGEAYYKASLDWADKSLLLLEDEE